MEGSSWEEEYKEKVIRGEKTGNWEDGRERKHERERVEEGRRGGAKEGDRERKSERKRK